MLGISTEHWNAIGAIGQWAGAIATFVVVFIVIWHENWKCPRLVVEFDSDRDVNTQINTVGVPGVGHQPSRWLRLRAMNKRGRAAAKNCRAFVVKANFQSIARRKER